MARSVLLSSLKSPVVTTFRLPTVLKTVDGVKFPFPSPRLTLTLLPKDKLLLPPWVSTTSKWPSLLTSAEVIPAPVQAPPPGLIVVPGPKLPPPEFKKTVNTPGLLGYDPILCAAATSGNPSSLKSPIVTSPAPSGDVGNVKNGSKASVPLPLPVEVPPLSSLTVTLIV